MMRKHICRSLLISACLPLLLPAQTNTENFAQLEFNFNNPGARAAALGGAFVSLADDATAAEANPAGLTALLNPEISFEVKRIAYTRNIPNFSHSGTAASFRLVGRDFSDDVISPAFVSAVYPFRKLTISAFRHELVNFKSDYSTLGSLIPGFADGSFYFPVRSETDLKVSNWGLAAGYKITDKISIGAAAGLSQLDVNSSMRRFNQNAVVTNSSTINDNDQDLFLNVGLLFKATDKLSVGGTFKRRPKFSVEHSLSDSAVPLPERRMIHFNVPSAFAVGASYAVTDVLTFSTDVVHVLYSQLTDDFVITSVTGAFTPADFEAKNGTELHFGGEYVGFFREVGYVLRAGFYTEPSSSIEFVGDTGTGSADIQFTRYVWRTLFTEGDSDQHFTFGLGLLLNQHLQLDFAGGLSSGSDELVGSLVIRR